MSAMENSDQLWKVEAAPEATGMPMAEWWRRFAALVIDAAIKAALRYLAPTHDKLAGSIVVSATR